MKCNYSLPKLTQAKFASRKSTLSYIDRLQIEQRNREAIYVDAADIKCKYCGTSANNISAKDGFYTCCCHLLQKNNGIITQRQKGTQKIIEKWYCED